MPFSVQSMTLLNPKHAQHTRNGAPAPRLTSCAAAAVILLGLDAAGKLSGQLQQLWGALSAWTATLLFCCQPIAQLAANFVRPEGVASLSLATLLLATLGNSMMVPRALLKRDVIWLTGTVWGVLAYGWGNLLSMALAHHMHGCGPLSHLYRCAWAVLAAATPVVAALW